ncbi:PHP domain-containing protein [Alphaproteobacteria bacterium]|nr:PHP domain-containing protein [Alphaproteobacteria bacterium]
MIVDLHVHTRRSMDGFSTLKDVFTAARKRKINFIAITEHDLPYLSDQALDLQFPDIKIIPGCEFTTDKGAHIIGLFVDNALPYGSTREEIFDYVRSSDGLLIMPHPYKPGSGYMTIYDNDSAIKNFDFIEIVNGGWRTGCFANLIMDLAKKHDLKMIASSDAHKAKQIGLCASKITGEAADLVGCKAVLSNLVQSQIEILMDTQLLMGKGRTMKWFQKYPLYQIFINLLPFSLRQKIKRFFYSVSLQKRAVVGDVKIISIHDLPW